MAKRNLLTALDLKRLKPRKKLYRKLDGDGLYVVIHPSAALSFEYRYKINSKGGTVTLNATTLAEARIEIEPLRGIVAAGHKPAVMKRLARAVAIATDAQTFELIAAAWVKSESRRKRWSADYIDEVKRSLRNHLQELNPLPISSIVARVTAPLLHTVEVSTPMMEEKIARRLNSIMDYAVEIGALEMNPLPRRRRGKIERKHFPAITAVPELGKILRAARATDPCKGVQRAHILLAFAVQRVSETVGARWDEFALDGVDVPIGDGHRVERDAAAGNWSIPRERMKRKDQNRGPHVVPLSPALLKTLREWREVDGRDAIFVCPAPRDTKKSITPEAIEKFYRDVLNLSGKHSPHSWRSAFSTVARDAGKSGEIIEAQLDHIVGNKIAAAYDRAQRLALRRELMQWYGEQLITARDVGP